MKVYLSDDQHDYFDHWPGPTDPFKQADWAKVAKTMSAQANLYLKAMQDTITQVAKAFERAQLNSVKVHESFEAFVKHETSCKHSSMPDRKNLKYPGIPARGQFPKRGL